MENREQQILSEIKLMMSSIRSQLERLDAKMAELQHVVDPEDFESESIDIDLDDVPVEEVPVVEEVMVQEIPLEEDLPEVVEEDLPEVMEDDLPEAESEAESETEVGPEAGSEAEPEQEAEVEPEAEVVTIADKAEESVKPTINDMLAADCAWRNDMPGSPVRDIRSAISLNDRVIFINMLFNEDAQSFVNTLTQINAMETLDQAIEYITGQFPEWDLNSELVYRFMMAVRRKVN